MYPIEIDSAFIPETDFDGHQKVTVGFYNVGDKPFKYVTFAFVGYNQVGDAVDAPQKVKFVGPFNKFTDVSLWKHWVESPTAVWLNPRNPARTVKITSIEIQYEDDTVETITDMSKILSSKDNQSIIYKATAAKRQQEQEESIKRRIRAKELKKKETKKKILIMSVLSAVIICIVAAFIIFNAVGKSNHDGSKIDAEVISTEASTTDSELRFYTNIKFKNDTKADINHIQVITTVYNQNGEEIGSITSSKDNFELKAGEETEVNFYLSKRNLNDTFFATLFQSEAGTLTFKSEVVYVGYTDGEYWSIYEN